MTLKFKVDRLESDEHSNGYIKQVVGDMYPLTPLIQPTNSGQNGHHRETIDPKDILSKLTTLEKVSRLVLDLC
jgi:hypothetical protein